MQYKLSIVVPCYNEAGNLPFIVEAFTAIVAINPSIQIVLVNNGSTDATSNILLKIFDRNDFESNFKIIDIKENKGYGYGILTGLQQSDGSILAWTHADMQTDPFDVVKALTVFEEVNDDMVVVKGKRRNRNWMDAFFTWGMEVYTNITLKTSLHDINAQPKLFSRKFYNAIAKDAPNDFSLDLFWLYQAKKPGSIKTIDVNFTKRLHGEAKGGGTFKGKWKLIKRTVLYISQLKVKIKATT